MAYLSIQSRDHKYCQIPIPLLVSRNYEYRDINTRMVYKKETSHQYCAKLLESNRNKFVYLTLSLSEGWYKVQCRSALVKTFSEWNPMIGYSQLGSTYTMSKTSLVENFKHGGKDDTGANMATHCCCESSAEVKFLGQPQTLIQETWSPENPNFRQTILTNFSWYCFPTLPATPTIASKNVEILDQMVHSSFTASSRL